MTIKIIITLLFLAIIASLGRALYYLINGKNTSSQMLKALTLRISLSMALFVLLLLAFAMGWITPHSL